MLHKHVETGLVSTRPLQLHQYHNHHDNDTMSAQVCASYLYLCVNGQEQNDSREFANVHCSQTNVRKTCPCVNTHLHSLLYYFREEPGNIVGRKLIFQSHDPDEVI